MHSADREVAAYILENLTFTPIDVGRVTPAAIAAAYDLTIDEVVAVTSADSAKGLRDLAETWGLLGDVFVGDVRIRRWLHAKGQRLGRTPVELLLSENGLREFTQLVGRIVYGAYR